MASTHVVAISPFTCEVDGEPIVIHEGDVFESTHPLVKGREELFAARDTHAVTTAKGGRTRRAA